MQCTQALERRQEEHRRRQAAAQQEVQQRNTPIVESDSAQRLATVHIRSGIAVGIRRKCLHLMRHHSKDRGGLANGSHGMQLELRTYWTSVKVHI